jgi:hypothetical protein
MMQVFEAAAAKGEGSAIYDSDEAVRALVGNGVDIEAVQAVAVDRLVAAGKITKPDQGWISVVEPTPVPMPDEVVKAASSNDPDLGAVSGSPLDDFEMTPLPDGIVEIEFNPLDTSCRHRVRWSHFAAVVKLTDFAVKNGTDALVTLMSRMNGVRTGRLGGSTYTGKA